MNYYEHHIGDYDADTAHLSWVEDMAYTRLLRLYYRKELPIPCDLAEACRLVRAQTRDQRAAVSSVLKEFFSLQEDGWHQKRCDADVDRYQKKVEHNREAGKKGGRPPKCKTQPKPPGFHSGSDFEPKDNPPQSPDSSHQSPPSEPDGSGGEPPAGRGGDLLRVKTPEEEKAELWRSAVELLAGQGVDQSQARAFFGKLVASHKADPALVGEAVRIAVAEQPADARSFLVATCQRLSGERKPPNRQEALEQRNASMMGEWAAQGDAHETV